MPGPLAEQLQALLGPDDTRASPTAAWWTVVLLGAAALLLALHSMADIDTGRFWLLAAGVVVAVAAVCLAVRVPRSAHTVALDDVFIVLLLLQLGPGAATVAAGAAAAARTWRRSRRWTSRIANPAMAALAMATAGQALQALLDALQRRQLGHPGLLLLAGVGFVVLHIAIHAGLVAALARPWRAARARLADRVGLLGWLATAHAASAALAALLFLAWRQSGVVMLAAAVSVIAALLVALHFFFRQQETAEAAHRAAAEAEDRAAALAASHRQAEHHRAFHDNLTGLPNRQGFLARLAETVQRGEAAPDHHGFAVISLDIDRFKLVNDSLGHAAGDAVLRQAAQRLLDTLGPGHLLARVGGDAFAVLVVDPTGQPAAETLAEQLLAAMRAPFCVAGTVVQGSASIGITSSALPCTRPEDMLRDADMAMHQAKAGGKSRAALFDIQLQARAQLRLRLETDLRSALQADQISLAYQPIFDLASGRVTAVEALARWSHPQLGPVSPGIFVAIAADAGLSNALTDHLVQRACQQLQHWRRSMPGTDALAVHVNITGHDLVHAGLAGRLLQALHAHGLQPRHLRLELGENTLMQHLAAALPMLATLRAAGIGLSLDDFGSGFSSLGHVHRLPIDSLKIDPSFVQALQAGQGTGADAAVVRAVVELGRSLGKGVVAEGIESASQLALLRAMGCLQGQGYHLAPPLAADAVPALLAQTGLVQPLAVVALPASLPAVSTLRH